MLNAVSILKDEKIYSRKRAMEMEKMQIDNASSDVIGQTDSHVFEYVRLYFRP